MRILAFSLLVILGAGLAPVVAAPRVVIVFGDSLTAGSALPANEKERLWLKLVEVESAGAVQLINEGKGGRPTNAVKEFEEMLKRRAKADALVIFLGTNDSRDITEACVPKAVENVRTMITRARQVYGKALPVLLAGPPNINREALGPTKPIGEQRDAKLRELGEGFAALAKAQGCEFISLYGVLPPQSLLRDGVHPDGAGNAALAKALLPPLLALAKAAGH